MSNWSIRAHLYNNLEWVNRSGYLHSFVQAGDFQPYDRVLDVGTGTGVVARAIAPLVDMVIGLDVSNDMLELANSPPNVEYRLGDILDLPFNSQMFDKVTARMVFHHIISNTLGAAAECYRVLKPGGKIILSEGTPPTPELEDWYTEMFALKEERLTFFDSDLINLVAGAGFKVTNVIPYVSRQVSIGNWLENSGLPLETQDTIMQMHIDLSDEGKKVYNMTETSTDILCDFRYVTVVGEK